MTVEMCVQTEFDHVTSESLFPETITFCNLKRDIGLTNNVMMQKPPTSCANLDTHFSHSSIVQHVKFPTMCSAFISWSDKVACVRNYDSPVNIITSVFELCRYKFHICSDFSQNT